MELRDYIEQGAKKAGSLTELGKILDMSQPTISGAKAHKRPMTNKAVVQLAEYIGADLKAVIAANELVTEKDEKKRAFWSPFVNHAKAASIALAFSLVTTFATPHPAEAASNQNSGKDRLCIMSNRQLRRHSEKRQLSRAILPFIHRTLETIKAALQLRIPQIQGI